MPGRWNTASTRVVNPYIYEKRPNIFLQFFTPHTTSSSAPPSKFKEQVCPLTEGNCAGQMVTVLLVDDDPLQAHVRRSILQRHFHDVERAGDAAEAFILVEEPLFAEKLGLVVVGLNRPGLGSPAFVAELRSRLPSVPVLVLGCGRDEASIYTEENVRFLPRTVPMDQLLIVSRQMIQQYTPRVA